MELLLKKDGSDRTTISHNDLAKLFKLASLEKKLQTLEARVSELQKQPEINQKYVLSLIDSKVLSSGEVINISHATSIEKLKSIKIGAIYYNSKKGVRLKTKEGWVTLKIE